jgi:hypothetical protein
MKMRTTRALTALMVAVALAFVAAASITLRPADTVANGYDTSPGVSASATSTR